MSGLPYLWSHLTFMLVMTGGFVAVCVACGAILDRSGAGLRSGSSVYRWRLLPAITLAALAFSWQLGSVMRGPVDLSGHLLALTGELSFGMLLFLGTMLAGRVFGSRWRVPAESWYAAQWIYLAAGLALYGTTLSGRGPQIYTWGYSGAMAWALLGMSAVAAIAGRGVLAVLFLGTVITWQWGVSPSGNLWDYAIDPFLFAGSAIQIIVRSVASGRKGGTKTDSSRKMDTATTVAAAA